MDSKVTLTEDQKRTIARLNEIEVNSKKRIYEYSIFGKQVDSNDKRELLLGEDENVENVDATDLGAEQNNAPEPPNPDVTTNNDTTPAATDVNQPVEDQVAQQTTDSVVDVTQLVTTQQDILAKLTLTSDNITNILAKNEELKNTIFNIQNRVAEIDNEVNNVKHEIIDRNPTPVEKLQLRSLEMYPYQTSLSQFWKEKEAEGNYEVSPNPNDEEEKPETFVITQDDIDNISDTDAKMSLGIR